LQPEILADENVDFRIIKDLRNKGFNVVSVLEDYRSISDKDILQLARDKKALLLTEDKDFGEWIFAHKEKSVGVIFLRYKADEYKEISKSLLGLLLKYGDFLYKKFAVVRVNKIRIRELP
jgi:predicted nuclease of predicted toxin-antitoxin system